MIHKLLILIICLRIYYPLQSNSASSNEVQNNQYYQVPQNILIMNKYQAYEPTHVFEGPLKGKGLEEPLLNFFVSKVRAAGISVYVDYFTTAKTVFYGKNNKYEICYPVTRNFYRYKEMIKRSRNGLSDFQGKIEKFSIPFTLYSPVSIFAILTDKVPQIEKHKFINTDIYDIRALLNDESLKTVKIAGSGDGISDYVYLNPETKDIIKPIYKKRVYEFVASNSYQTTLMLQGRRMDCAPRSSGKGNVVT